MKKIVILLLLAVISNSGFSQSKTIKDFSRYVQIPSLDFQEYQKMDVPTQAKYDRRKSELQDKINEVYKLNKDKLYEKDQKSFNDFNTSIESYFQNLPNDYADFTKDFRYREIMSKMDGFEKMINKKATEKSSPATVSALASDAGIPKSFSAMEVVQWGQQLKFIPKYETTASFQLEAMSLSSKNIKELIKNAKKIDQNATQKTEMVEEMVKFWDNNISSNQISQHFFKYYVFYNIDKGYFIKNHMEGKQFKTYPSKG